MAKINTQFHATSDEILNLIRECSQEYNLHAAIIQSFPTFRVTLPNPVEGALSNLDRSKRIFIHLYTYFPDLETKNEWEFLDKNPDGLYITIGKDNDNQLQESSIGSIVFDVDTLKLWKKIIRKFKSNTYTGAWVVNPNIGEKGYYKHHRYTVGAKKLFLEGVKILPFAGGNYFILSESLEDNLP
jgi:hypothetical protein